MRDWEMISNILNSKSNNPHYLGRYIKFINGCLQKNKEIASMGKSERHHICPKASDMFPKYKSIKHYSWNCANLSIEQHTIAHHLLWLAYKNKSQTSGYFMRTKINGIKLTAKAASKLREEYVLMSIGTGNSFYGKRHSTETKDKISRAKKGKYYPTAFGKTRGRCGVANHFSYQDFSGTKNGFYGKINVFDKEQGIKIIINVVEYHKNPNRYLSLTSNEYRSMIRSHIIRPSIIADKNPMYGKTKVYDIQIQKMILISKEEYVIGKGTRYHHMNSSFVRKMS